MTTCYFAYFCDDELGEVEAFYEEKNKKLSLIDFFYCNDASYRDEYMGGLFQHFGIKMKSLPDNKEKEALKLLRARAA